jgi:SP family general alpha glucoside:H+ symporter-like MFS transporter
LTLATFQKKYGSLQPDGTYQISAAWDSGLSNSAAIGEILGLIITGLIAKRFGYRFTIEAACQGMRTTKVDLAR